MAMARLVRVPFQTLSLHLLISHGHRCRAHCQKLAWYSWVPLPFVVMMEVIAKPLAASIEPGPCLYTRIRTQNQIHTLPWS